MFECFFAFCLCRKTCLTSDGGWCLKSWRRSCFDDSLDHIAFLFFILGFGGGGVGGGGGIVKGFCFSFSLACWEDSASTPTAHMLLSYLHNSLQQDLALVQGRTHQGSICDRRGNRSDGGAQWLWQKQGKVWSDSGAQRLWQEWDWVWSDSGAQCLWQKRGQMWSDGGAQCLWQKQCRV